MRLEAAGIHRDVVIDQRAEHIEHAAARDRRGRIEVVGALRAGAGEVDGRLARLAVDRDGDLDAAPLSVSTSKRDGLRAGDDAARRFGGIVLDMAHIGRDHSEPVMRAPCLPVRRALRVGGDLRLQVGDVLRGVARGVGAFGQKLAARRPRGNGRALDQLEIVDIDAFLLDARRLGRIEPGVMPPISA